MHTHKYDVVIIGAGAAGLMCAAEAGKRGRRVLVIDHAEKPGKKILISGGGRCNFTNRNTEAENYLSTNPHFCKSALQRFPPAAFISLVEKHGIRYQERSHGQLFCSENAGQIVEMLLQESRNGGVRIEVNTTITKVEGVPGQHYLISTNNGLFKTSSLVVASGGLSIPGAGASPLGYEIARQFGLEIRSTRAGLVPLTLQPADKEQFATLTGIAVDSLVSTSIISFRENLLFTHRGLSGPAILQISSYWQPGETITIDFLPGSALDVVLSEAQKSQPKKLVKTLLSELLPKRLVGALLPEDLAGKTLADLSRTESTQVAALIHNRMIKPAGSEGYRTAEVTCGGVSVDKLSSKTFECREVPGLYFIGEVLDVTGWLGGYNLHWAWASGWCAGQYV